MFITTRPRHKLFISARRLVGEAVVKLQLVQTNMKVNQKMLPQQVRSREINTTELIHQCPSSGWQQTQPHAVSGETSGNAFHYGWVRCGAAALRPAGIMASGLGSRAAFLALPRSLKPPSLSMFLLLRLRNCSSRGSHPDD